MGVLAMIIVIGLFGKLFYSKTSFFIRLIASYWQISVEDTIQNLARQYGQSGPLENWYLKLNNCLAFYTLP